MEVEIGRGKKGRRNGKVSIQEHAVLAFRGVAPVSEGDCRSIGSGDSQS